MNTVYLFVFYFLYFNTRKSSIFYFIINLNSYISVEHDRQKQTE